MECSTTLEREAVAIYAVMDRDPSDALDMILECENRSALEMLLKMLKHERPGTDVELNRIFVGPVERRLSALEGAK